MSEALFEWNALSMEASSPRCHYPESRFAPGDFARIVCVLLLANEECRFGRLSSAEFVICHVPIGAGGENYRPCC